MLQSLEKSERFNTEFKTYQAKINEITNPRIHDELVDLLRQLVVEVRNIDVHHNDLFLGKRLSGDVNDARAKLVEIRKKINRRLEDWERSQAQ